MDNRRCIATNPCRQPCWNSGKDHEQWLPQGAQPSGLPNEWIAGIILELSMLATLTSGKSLRATSVAGIGQSHERRLAEARSRGEVVERAFDACTSRFR